MNNNYGGGYNNGGGRGGRGRGRGRGGYGGRGGRGGFNNKRKFDNGDDYNQGYGNNKRGRWNSETNYENSESAAESSSNNHAVASTVPEVEIRKNFYSEHPRTAEMTHEEVEKYRSQHNITVESEDCPKFVTEFEYAGFPEAVVNNLKEQGFKQPTPIQAQCWPISMQGRDLIGLAETGSGKTLSFLLPAMVHIDAQPRVQGGEGPILLILAPTRELAIQIEAVAQTACKAYAGSIRSTCIYGGVPKGPQIEALATGSEILIATPGRLIDLMEEGHFGLSRVTYLVLDEADRMLDMGFEPQIRQIMKYVTHSQRQTAMYSATWPDDVRKLASEFLSTERVKVNIGSVELAASHQITQIVQVCEEWDKKNMLLSLLKKLHNGKTKIIIFMLYKKACDFLSNFLGRSRYPVACLHGDMSQAQREQQIASFKSGELPILIATDVAARGLDIKDVKYVINYEFPLRIEDYVHRIGRTGRAGEKGTAYTYFTKENKEFSRDLYKILTEAKQQIPDQLEQWKHIGPKTQKQTPMTKLYGKGQWNIREGSESQKKHIKFDD